MSESDACVHGGIEFDCVTVCLHGLAKQSAKTQNLYQAGEGLGLLGMASQAVDEPHHGLRGATAVDFDESVELVSGREFGVEGEGALEGGLGEIGIGRGARSELVEKPAAAPQPRPRGREIRFLGERDPVEIPSLLHGCERALARQISGAHKSVISRAANAGLAQDGRFKAVAVFRDGTDGTAADDFAQCSDEIGKVRIADMDGGPKGRCEFLLADQMLGVADEAEKGVKSARLERYYVASPAQQPVLRVKLEFTKAVS